SLRERGEPAWARDQQGGQPPGARDEDRAGLGLAEVPALQRAESVVSASVRGGEHAAPQGGDRGVGPEAAGGVVEVPGDRRGAGGGGAGREEEVPGRGRRTTDCVVSRTDPGSPSAWRGGRSGWW